MMLKKTLATSFTALALAGVAAGTASAQDDISNDNNVLNCNSIRVIDVPILSAANDNIDCSRNVDIDVKGHGY
ncbi:hypothetical protein GCM10018793_33380 [Streptomyces sulfonofaciens]|uniref:Uncharacterized protein n=1 Tax=Streptomyces sulfonofaciens TaxID=68272 RepID=A0A919G845_9ACTN|nr:hypothetical protein [Streptomyces sulfonofaciens]GHH79823.1 hypothetical protein GCM10018793_33380 [Streptomyces sulfonofaciens]